MKKLIVCLSLLLVGGGLSAQWSWEINFDYPWYLEKIQIDTLSNPDCLWQIGQPAKSDFDSAYSIPNAILTDTIDPVPPNDTSVFYLLHERNNNNPFHIFTLRFWFRLQGDTTDFGIVEISPDEGENWINVLTEDEIYSMWWFSDKPSLKGSTAGWQQFYLDISEWASGYGDFPIQMTADTILFRFTYVTDDNSDPYDGWMIDNIWCEDWWEGVEELRDENIVQIYPNPASDVLFLKTNTIQEGPSIQLLNASGQLLFSDPCFSDDKIDLSHFENGIYFLRYASDHKFAVKKFIVRH